MTLAYAIETADRQVINPLPRSDKLRWLSGLDARLFRLLPALRGAEQTFTPYEENTPEDTELLLPLPHDEVYRWYLEMHIYGAEGETARYNIAAAKYNAALQACLDDFSRSCPAGTERLRLW